MSFMQVKPTEHDLRRSMVVCSEQFRPQYCLKIKVIYIYIVILSSNPRKSSTWFIHAWHASTGNVETWYTCASNIHDKSKNRLIEIWHQHPVPLSTKMFMASLMLSKVSEPSWVDEKSCLQYFFCIYQISYHNRYTLKSAFPSKTSFPPRTSSCHRCFESNFAFKTDSWVKRLM